MATVHLSTSLARYAGGAESLSVDASRVDAMLREVTQRYPQLAGPLEIMAIAVDGEIRHDPDYVRLSSESEVHFVPRIAGG